MPVTLFLAGWTKSGDNILTRTFAVPSARCRQGGLTAYIQEKRASVTEALFIKSGDDLLSHKRLQYHRPAVDKGD